MRVSALFLIGALCLSVAALTVAMAAPSKRTIAIVVVGLPFVLGSVVAFRKHRESSRLRSLQTTAASRERPIAAAVPDPYDFIASAPRLAGEFRRWAVTRFKGPLDTIEDLETFAVRHSDSIPPDGRLFLSWVAAYGATLRSTTRGRWVVGRFFARGEPLVVSGRFPFLRHRVLLAAAQLLDFAEDMKRV